MQSVHFLKGCNTQPLIQKAMEEVPEKDVIPLPDPKITNIEEMFHINMSESKQRKVLAHFYESNQQYLDALQQAFDEFSQVRVPIPILSRAPHSLMVAVLTKLPLQSGESQELVVFAMPSWVVSFKNTNRRHRKTLDPSAISEFVVLSVVQSLQILLNQLPGADRSKIVERYAEKIYNPWQKKIYSLEFQPGLHFPTAPSFFHLAEYNIPSLIKPYHQFKPMLSLTSSEMPTKKNTSAVPSKPKPEAGAPKRSREEQTKASPVTSRVDDDHEEEEDGEVDSSQAFQKFLQRLDGLSQPSTFLEEVGPRIKRRIETSASKRTKHPHITPETHHSQPEFRIPKALKQVGVKPAALLTPSEVGALIATTPGPELHKIREDMQNMLDGATSDIGKEFTAHRSPNEVPKKDDYVRSQLLITAVACASSKIFTEEVASLVREVRDEVSELYKSLESAYRAAESRHATERHSNADRIAKLSSERDELSISLQQAKDEIVQLKAAQEPQGEPAL